MRWKFLRCAAVAGAAVLSVSCTTTPGAFQSEEKDQPHAVFTANTIVTEPIPIAVSHLSVMKVDGKPPGGRWGEYYRLSPGPHEVQLRCVSGQTLAVVDLKFSAVAGQHYVAGGKRPHRDVRFWIEDKATKEVLVSKEVPLQPNPAAGPLIVPIVMPAR